MKKEIFYCIILLILFQSAAYSQIYRMNALGGMTIALSDKDNSVNLYDFGKNPAWLINDEMQSWLDVVPGFYSADGDYRRLFDPRKTSIYSTKFDGVKTLGSLGAFRGYAIYEIERRKDVFSALNRNPYAGEAFFMADATSNNFNYNGPTVGFIYSYELFPQIFIGGKAQYQLLDGLKQVYSSTKTLYRGVEGNFGIAYRACDGVEVGFSLEPFDNQERIEAQSEVAYDVEIFNYRGETYAFKRRGNLIEQKLREAGINYSAQATLQPIQNINVGIKGDYFVSGKKVIIPMGLLKETEEGFTSFENYNMHLLSRWKIRENLNFGFSAKHINRDSWSRYTAKNLLLWKWNIQETTFGVGTTYEILPRSLLVGLEAECGILTADSSKYIDNKFVNSTSSNYLIRSGVEYEILNDIFLRIGFVKGYREFDVIKNSKDLNILSITSGLGIGVFESFGVDLCFDYTNYSPRNSNKSFSTLNGFIGIKLTN